VFKEPAFGVQGTPYLYGGVTTASVSIAQVSLKYAFSAAGVSLPRTCKCTILLASTKVSQSEQNLRDLVFL